MFWHCGLRIPDAEQRPLRKLTHWTVMHLQTWDSVLCSLEAMIACFSERVSGVSQVNLELCIFFLSALEYVHLRTSICRLEWNQHITSATSPSFKFHPSLHRFSPILSSNAYEHIINYPAYHVISAHQGFLSLDGMVHSHFVQLFID